MYPARAVIDIRDRGDHAGAIIDIHQSCAATGGQGHGATPIPPAISRAAGENPDIIGGIGQEQNTGGACANIHTVRERHGQRASIIGTRSGICMAGRGSGDIKADCGSGGATACTTVPGRD